MKSKWWTWLFAAAGVIAGLIAYPDMPERMPVHWGITGEADRFADKAFAVFLLPAVMLIVATVFQLARGIESKKNNSGAYASSLGIMQNVIVLALLALHGYILAYGYGVGIGIGRVVAPVIGIILMVTGNYMPRLRQNRIAGIRTPSTLGNKEIWRKSHHTGGKLLVAGGLLMMLTVVLPGRAQLTLFLIIAALTAISPLYAIYRAKKQS